MDEIDEQTKSPTRLLKDGHTSVAKSFVGYSHFSDSFPDERSWHQIHNTQQYYLLEQIEATIIMPSRLSTYYCSSLLLWASLLQQQGSYANEVTSQKLYTIDVTHKIKFFFNETDLPSPDSLPDDADNLDDLRRLTQIYYIRLMAGFSQSYQGVEVHYDSHKWLTMDTETDAGELQYDYTDLIMDFELLVKFKDDDILPDETDVLEKILVGGDASLYTSNFVSWAKPKNIFQT